MTELAVGQWWRPKNGMPARRIEKIDAAGIADYGHPIGTLMILWAINADKFGWCRQSSFRAWIRKTGARCD